MYAEDFYENYIKPNGALSFTHKDIQIYTDANCSYSVLESLKTFLFNLGFIVTEKEEERINSKGQKKKFKRYYINEKETK